MTTAWSNLLLNGYSLTSNLQLPEMDTPGALDTTMVITVSDCTGSPSTAVLTAQFEALQPTSGGATTEANPGGMFTQITAAYGAQPACLPDGDWPATIADQTTVKTAITGVGTTAGSTAATVTAGQPFAVGQRMQGTSIAAGASNYITAIGSGGGSGQAGSSATLRFPAISTDSAGTATLYTNPVQVSRRITGVPYWRVILLPTFTGGSSPAFTITVLAVTRY